jgi:hypothetical protein
MVSEPLPPSACRTATAPATSLHPHCAMTHACSPGPPTPGYHHTTICHSTTIRASAANGQELSSPSDPSCPGGVFGAFGAFGPHSPSASSAANNCHPSHHQPRLIYSKRLLDIAPNCATVRMPSHGTIPSEWSERDASACAAGPGQVCCSASMAGGGGCVLASPACSRASPAGSQTWAVCVVLGAGG